MCHESDNDMLRLHIVPQSRPNSKQEEAKPRLFLKKEPGPEFREHMKMGRQYPPFYF